MDSRELDSSGRGGRGVSTDKQNTGARFSHFDFTAPGSLLLVVGLAIAVMAFPVGFTSWMPWLLVALLIACGIGLLSRHLVGSVLFLGVLGLWLYHNLRGGIPPEDSDRASLVFSMILLASFVPTSINQFKYHRHPGAKR